MVSGDSFHFFQPHGRKLNLRFFFAVTAPKNKHIRCGRKKLASHKLIFFDTVLVSTGVHSCFGLNLLLKEGATLQSMEPPAAGCCECAEISLILSRLLQYPFVDFGPVKCSGTHQSSSGFSTYCQLAVFNIVCLTTACSIQSALHFRGESFWFSAFKLKPVYAKACAVRVDA
jgi:hypothetical protein